MKRTHANHDRAFSMIELVMVMVIIGIVTAIAIPRFADAATGRRITAMKNTLENDIDMMKIRARATSKPHLIKFYLDKDFYIIFEGTTMERESIVLLRDLTADPYTVDLIKTNLGTDAYASVTAYGDVSPGFSVAVEHNDIQVTVVIDGISDSEVTASDALSGVETIVDDVLSGLFGK